MIKNIKEKLIYFILAILCCTGVAFLSCPGILRALDSNCEEAKANVKILRKLTEGQIHSINEFEHLKKAIDLLTIQLFDVKDKINSK